MSQSSFERGYERGSSGQDMGGKPKNFLTATLGPLPVWAWGLIVLGGAFAYWIWAKNQSSSSTSSTASTTGTTDSSLIPQFVNQTYTNVTPPSDGNNGPGPTTAGSSDVVVPNLIGEAADQAQPALSAIGLTSDLSGPTFKAGQGTRIIAFQNPQAGATVAKGTKVTLGYKIVSGNKTTTDVKGKPVTTTTPPTKKS